MLMVRYTHKHTGELLCDLSKKERAFLCPISVCNISPNGKDTCGRYC